VLINKANSDPHSEAFRVAMGGRLAACGVQGGAAIATAFRHLAAAGDTSNLRRVRFSVEHNRSNAILDAALSVAGDSRAPLALRVVAVETALRQHIIVLGFSGDVAEIAANPWGRICKVSLVSGDGYSSGETLGSDALGRTVGTLQGIAANESESAVLRDLATCVVWELTENKGS
jgi:hypothetical protein